MIRRPAGRPFASPKRPEFEKVVLNLSSPDDNRDESDARPIRGKAMGFFDHLEELRWTLVKCAAAFLVAAILVGYFMREFNDLLLWPLHKVQAAHPEVNLELSSISIMEGFNVVIQMCLAGGLALAAPFIAFFLGQFVAPALTQRELKVVLPVCFSAVVLFLSGAVFSFYLLVPSTISVALDLNTYFHWTPHWTPATYYSVLLWLVLGMGSGFEFPLIIVMLVWIGVMSTAFLRKYRRHAIVVIFIIAALITPTPDPFNQTLVAAPLYFLYEVAIFVGSRVEKRREANLIAQGIG